MTASTGPVQVTCPTCGVAFPVPTEVLGIDGHQVLVRMDRSDLYGHLSACAGEAGEQASAEQPTKALERPSTPAPVVAPAFVAKGRRTCTMCGTTGSDCLQRLHAEHTACCGACGDGNTHPAPQDTVPCQSWAADRAQD